MHHTRYHRYRQHDSEMDKHIELMDKARVRPQYQYIPKYSALNPSFQHRQIDPLRSKNLNMKNPMSDPKFYQDYMNKKQYEQNLMQDQKTRPPQNLQQKYEQQRQQMFNDALKSNLTPSQPIKPWLLKR